MFCSGTFSLWIVSWRFWTGSTLTWNDYFVFYDLHSCFFFCMIVFSFIFHKLYLFHLWFFLWNAIIVQVSLCLTLGNFFGSFYYRILWQAYDTCTINILLGVFIYDRKPICWTSPISRMQELGNVLKHQR